jgi:RecA/RadA recombinase
MTNKWLSQLRKLEGAVEFDKNPMETCLRSPSPSVNWALNNPGCGLPFGYGMLLFGPPKGGKSLLVNSYIGELHQSDPEAIAIVFNTELRGELQANSTQLAKFGVDAERLVVYDVNTPEEVFDRIEKDINALCQEGAPIKMVVIDSLNHVQGRRSMNADTVMTQQIGDHALTISTGLKRILPVIRRQKIAFICTDHVRAEMDPKEQMRGKTVKPASAWATKHALEVFCYVEPNRSKEGRTTLLGEDLLDETSKDIMDKAEATGHKIRFRVEASSWGVAGRTAEFTLNYDRGVINTHEEVFVLAKNLGIITKPNNQTYQYKDKTWRGIASCLTAIREDGGLYKAILEEIYATNSRGL